MGGRPHPLILKPLDNFVSMHPEAGRLKIIMIVEQIDESLQFVGKQKCAKLLAVSFLNINQGMLAVEVGDDEVPRRRDP
jgi:sulfur carrier protein ThiS